MKTREQTLAKWNKYTGNSQQFHHQRTICLVFAFKRKLKSTTLSDHSKRRTFQNWKTNRTNMQEEIQLFYLGRQNSHLFGLLL